MVLAFSRRLCGQMCGDERSVFQQCCDHRVFVDLSRHWITLGLSWVGRQTISSLTTCWTSDFLSSQLIWCVAALAAVPRRLMMSVPRHPTMTTIPQQLFRLTAPRRLQVRLTGPLHSQQHSWPQRASSSCLVSTHYAMVSCPRVPQSKPRLDVLLVPPLAHRTMTCSPLWPRNRLWISHGSLSVLLQEQLPQQIPYDLAYTKLGWMALGPT